MDDKTTERLVSAFIVIATASIGGGAYFTKANGPTADEVVREMKDDSVQVHHELQMEDQRQMFEDISTKTRVTDLERNQAVQKVMLEEILVEVKNE